MAASARRPSSTAMRRARDVFQRMETRSVPTRILLAATAEARPILAKRRPRRRSESMNGVEKSRVPLPRACRRSIPIPSRGERISKKNIPDNRRRKTVSPEGGERGI